MEGDRTCDADRTGAALIRKMRNSNCRDSIKLISNHYTEKGEIACNKLHHYKQSIKILPSNQPKMEIFTGNPWPQTEIPAACSGLNNWESLSCGIINVSFSNYECKAEES